MPHVYVIARKHDESHNKYSCVAEWSDIPPLKRSANMQGVEFYAPLPAERFLRKMMLAEHPFDSYNNLKDYVNWLLKPENADVLVIFPFFRTPQRFLELGIGVKHMDTLVKDRPAHLQYEKYRDQWRKLCDHILAQSVEVHSGRLRLRPSDVSTGKQHGVQTETMRQLYIRTLFRPAVPWGTGKVDERKTTVVQGDYCSMSGIQDAYVKLYLLLHWALYWWLGVD